MYAGTVARSQVSLTVNLRTVPYCGKWKLAYCRLFHLRINPAYSPSRPLQGGGVLLQKDKRSDIQIRVYASNLCVPRESRGNVLSKNGLSTGEMLCRSLLSLSQTLARPCTKASSGSLQALELGFPATAQVDGDKRPGMVCIPSS